MKKILIITILMSFLISCETTAQILNPNINQAKQDIVGTWILENDSQTKFVYDTNGVVKTYYANVLGGTQNYEISYSCDGETLSNGLFLKTMNNQNQLIDCSYIDNINYNNNNKMTLVTQKRGEVIILLKQP